MRLCLLTASLAVFSACSVPVNEPAPKKAAPAVVKPPDESRRFPVENRVRIELVEQKLLGRDFLPGGNLAEYKRGGTTYRQFLIRAESADKAAFLMFDYKSTLRDPKFLAHMGGYFGFDGDQPVYVFAKGVFFAGLIGLPEKEADALAREFAARL